MKVLLSEWVGEDQGSQTGDSRQRFPASASALVAMLGSEGSPLALVFQLMLR